MGVLGGGLPDNLPLARITGGLAHRRSAHHFLSDLPPDQIRARLDGYTSFLFVRHPLERLVSAYQNKFANAAEDGYFPKLFAAKIKARYGSGNGTGTGGASRGGGARVTFEEFARWVSDPRPTEGARNEH